MSGGPRQADGRFALISGQRRIGAGNKEQGHQLVIPILRRRVQRREATILTRVGVSAVFQQETAERQAVIGHGGVNRLQRLVIA